MTTTVDRLEGPIADIPMIDHHCHAPRRLPQAIDAFDLRAAFTESTLRDVQIEDVPHTIAYRALIRWLALLVNCEPNEQDVIRARTRLSPQDYQRLLIADAGIASVYADYLFQEAGSYTPEEWAHLIDRPLRPILRIETFAERLLPAASAWEDFRHQFAESLAASRTRGVIAFKSIAAYRGGLDIQQVDAASAGAAFDEVRAEVEGGTFTRLENRTLIHALLWETLEVASELTMPVQFHVGLGDDDVFLPSSNPTLMRAIFLEPRYRAVPLVLLHCYPYVREAAYLASIYPNVFVDLGLTAPLASADCAALIRQALGLAPLTKVLASTDGHGVPEFQWFAARLWRVSLTRALAQTVEDDLLDADGALEVANLVLHANAERLYQP